MTTSGCRHKNNRRNRVKLKVDALALLLTIKENYSLEPCDYVRLEEIAERLRK